MKTNALVLLLGLLVGTSAMAGPGRLRRVVEDKVTTAAEFAVKEKYGVECAPVNPDLIHWRCLNGPACGYTFVISCPATKSAQKSVEIEVTGFDNGRENDLQSLQFKTVP